MSYSYRQDLRPLYEDENKLKTVHREQNTNAGLWLDKYIKNQSQDDTESRSGLVREVSSLAIPDAYKQFYKRWEQGIIDIDARKRIAKANGRIVIGLGDESVLETSIALHHTYGVPYIPGSALKGLAASYARQRLAPQDWGKESDAYKLIFGDTSEAGCITFFDALLHIDPQKTAKPVLYQDIITVHHPDYYRRTTKDASNDAAPADWDSPTPIPFLSATGEYLIALGAPDDLERRQTWLNKTFSILRYALQEMGIGAKTSSGYGRMDLAKTEEDDINEVIHEKVSVRLLREIAASPQVTYEHFDGWQRLPPDDDGSIDVAKELLKKMESVGGKKRMPKEEKRYMVLKKFLAENTNHN